MSPYLRSPCQSVWVLMRYTIRKRPARDRHICVSWWTMRNAFCENINGKIRTYIEISRGIANFARFRKRVLFALNPKIFYSLTEKLYSLKKEGKKR
ncbi:MAG: transposase, partial [Erysipelotrichaceae bacterium]|nr:transposase [Erysipelotrichaceae bacterium]